MSTELKSKSDVSIVLFFFTALAVFGVAGGGYFAHDYARARASVTWPAVDGIVLSQIDDERAHVRYVYSVDGRSYESTRVRGFLAGFMKGDSGEYRAGESVTVFVNPQDPEYSVLHTGGAGTAFITLSLVSGLAVFFGLGGVVWTLSRTNVHALEPDRDTALF